MHSCVHTGTPGSASPSDWLSLPTREPAGTLFLTVLHGSGHLDMGRKWLQAHLHHAPVMPRHLLPRYGELLQPVSNYTRKKLVSLVFPLLKKPICICLSPYLNINSKNGLGTKSCFYAVKIITQCRPVFKCHRREWFLQQDGGGSHSTLCDLSTIQSYYLYGIWVYNLYVTWPYSQNWKAAVGFSSSLCNQLSPIVYFMPSGPACWRWVSPFQPKASSYFSPVVTLALRWLSHLGEPSPLPSGRGAFCTCRASRDLGSRPSYTFIHTRNLWK